MTEEQRQAAQKVRAARNDLNTAVKEARKLGVEVRMTVENHIKWLDSPAGGRVHVKAACLRCGHTATWEALDDDLPLVRLTKRLVCLQCGARTMKAERVTGSSFRPAHSRSGGPSRE